MKRLTLLLIALMISTAPITAGVLKKNGLACKTAEDYLALLSAAVNDHDRIGTKLMEQGRCVQVNAPVEVQYVSEDKLVIIEIKDDDGLTWYIEQNDYEGF